MLTRLTIRNFKLFEEVEIPLDNGVVFIGPNNSGKTSALQALSLWHLGVQKWAQRRDPENREKIPKKRPGITINRLDLIPLPVGEIDLLWRERKVRTTTEWVHLELIVAGISGGESWECGLEFDYANADAMYCRPLRLDDQAQRRMPIPPQAPATGLALLPSMLGLAAEEALIREGRINVLIGQGQTAEVLRNLCYLVYQGGSADTDTGSPDWRRLQQDMRQLFGVELQAPRYLAARGTIAMAYREAGSNKALDLPSCGRGLQQVLLLLAYLYHNPPGMVLLLDEPDAHLEILRQRQIYDRLTQVADARGSQVIAASHSEVLMNKAAERNTLVAFIGRPHPMTPQGSSQLIKALRDIGFEYYAMAEAEGWMLYLESESDLRILQAFAERLEHPASQRLAKPPVKFLGTNLPQAARNHFHGLREAKPDLVGLLLLDRIDKELASSDVFREMMWQKREMKNYLCASPETLLAFAESGPPDDLFARVEQQQRRDTMEQAIEAMVEALATVGKPSPFSSDIKASDEFLEPLFKNYAKAQERPPACSLKHADYYRLVGFIPEAEVDPEIIEKLDAIEATASRANPG